MSERLDRALKNLQRLISNLGEELNLSPETDYPVFFAENKTEFDFITRALFEVGLIDIKRTPQITTITLTVKGWNRIAELERTVSGKDSKQAFVAMSFNPDLDNAYKNGIGKAITSIGYKPLRVDLQEHNEKICDLIISEIRKSRFMVADFTGQKGGVYFEAGFALGLGIPVIWTCKKTDEAKLHFDTRQYNHILWNDETDLYEGLLQRIGATIF